MVPARLIPLTIELANAIIDVDDICMSEGLGPDRPYAAAWETLVIAAECETGRSAVSATYRNNDD